MILTKQKATPTNTLPQRSNDHSQVLKDNRHDKSIQRKIVVGKANSGAASHLSIQAWNEAFLANTGKQGIEYLPAYRSFYMNENVTVHVNIEDTSPDYLQQISKLFEDPDYVNLPYEQLISIAPDVTITQDAVHKTPISGSQSLVFEDADVTPEEQHLSGKKNELLIGIIHQAKNRIQTIVHLLGQLRSGALSPELYLFKKTLIETLKIPNQENEASALRVLHFVFQRMAQRLEQDVIHVRTMTKKKKADHPTEQGSSSPPLQKKWLIDKTNERVADWLMWLHQSGDDFRGNIVMRLDADQLLYPDVYFEKLVHTFIHEVSHAAAATHDFAYTHEGRFKELNFLQHLANADTIAEIAMIIAQPEVSDRKMESKQNEDGGAGSSSQPAKLSKPDVVLALKELQGSIKSDDALKIGVVELLRKNGYRWSDVDDEFDFDEDRLVMLML